MNTNPDTRHGIAAHSNLLQRSLNALRRKCQRLEAENERLRRPIRQPRQRTFEEISG